MRLVNGSIHVALLCFDEVPTRNGHWYNVSTSPSSFGSALTSASQSLYNDMTEFLATIASAEENAFTSRILSNAPVWIGGREFRHYGKWPGQTDLNKDKLLYTLRGSKASTSPTRSPIALMLIAVANGVLRYGQVLCPTS